MNLVHLSNYSIDISTIRYIEWNVSEVGYINKKIEGTRINFNSSPNFVAILLKADDPNYLEDVAKLREAVGK